MPRAAMSKEFPKLLNVLATPMIWVMLLCAFGLVAFLILSLFDLGMSQALNNAIFFSLIGVCLSLQGILLFVINYYKEEGFEVAAPYAGRQKTSKGLSLLFSAILLLMGLAAFVAAFSFLQSRLP